MARLTAILSSGIRKMTAETPACHLPGGNLPPVPDASDLPSLPDAADLFYDERLLLRLLSSPSFANADTFLVTWR
ncbi:hypothetical protein [Klebsiella pneumoniae]|uniref:hypothetical protein n=1 Tax=Klebsiella pneumoniae TaxID=573 RepID=UPI0022B6C07D|nr:hypothetical protein [Klebsiella pneumoniae]